ncbi:MAG: NAD-dependent succinate-semialdehyde dehydrogenase [Maricaulaceae bacterium]
MAATVETLIGRDPAGRLVMGGQWRPAESEARTPVIDPARETLLAEVADAGPEDTATALDLADRAQKRWASTPPRARSDVLMRAFAEMAKRRDALAQLITAENGKALSDAYAEVDYAAEFFRWYAEEAVRGAGRLMPAPKGGGRILVVNHPVGISVLITPWNFPAAMATRKLAPALAAGCACILKPAPDTPLTALAIADILRNAGLPDGVVSVLPTTRAGALVEPLLADPRVRKLSFTGSTAVGRRLLALAGERVLNVSMELGGDAPLIVYDDADLDLAVSGAMTAKMRNGGQACTAANRFYVQSGVWDTFVERFTTAMAAVTFGPGDREGVELGPLINAAAQTKLARLVEDSRARGGEVALGGAPLEGPGHFFPPTVVTATHTLDLVDEEVFGPAAPIMRFEDPQAAIAHANRVDSGLVGYVFTRDLAKGLRTAERLETGMVGLNRGVVSDPAAPFGGVKQSGLGREGGPEGLEAFQETQYIATDWG